MVPWHQVWTEMKQGSFVLPPQAQPFYWRTSKMDPQGQRPFLQEFTPTSYLEPEADPEVFSSYYGSARYVVSFFNLSRDTLLVVPIPKRGRNFSHLNNFLKEASPTHQKAFWRHVAHKIHQQLAVWGHCWMSTHGHGVNYFHLRLCQKPKYYGSSQLRYLV